MDELTQIQEESRIDYESNYQGFKSKEFASRDNMPTIALNRALVKDNISHQSFRINSERLQVLSGKKL